jgi:LPXTG-motif cell wall-anchored protein
MDQKKLARLILILGLLLTLISITADFIGLGNYPGFGPQQTIATIIGVVIFLIGSFLYFQKKKDPE